MVVTMVVGFVPRIKVSPETLLVSRGRMLSSAEIVRDSVPVFSMGSSPVPLSSTLVKPVATVMRTRADAKPDGGLQLGLARIVKLFMSKSGSGGRRPSKL